MPMAAIALQISRAISAEPDSSVPHWRPTGAIIEVGVRVIRLFSFVAARRGFDTVLRDEMIPELRAMPDLVDSYVGRQESDGPRIVVSVWDSRAAMVAGVGDTLGVFHPEYLDATSGAVLEILDVRASWQHPREDPRILRVLRGEVRAGELDVYASGGRAWRGTGRDGRTRADRLVPRPFRRAVIRHGVGLARVVGHRARDGRQHQPAPRDEPPGAADDLGGRALRDRVAAPPAR